MGELLGGALCVALGMIVWTLCSIARERWGK